MNDNTHELFLDGHMPAFTYNGTRYADGIIRITSPVDTMKCEASITTFTDNGHNLGLKLLANASQNNLTTTLRWDNHFPEKQMSGEFNAIMQLYRNLADKPEAHVRVQPSHIILNNSTWNVEPSDIIYHDNYLLVDHFSLHHNQQDIIIDGIASKHENDSLTVDLNEVEVGYILDLVNFHSVEFSGKATGRAHASSLLGKFAANADLRVDDFKFERGHMGVLHAKANWNQELEQIDINAVRPRRTCLSFQIICKNPIDSRSNSRMLNARSRRHKIRLPFNQFRNRRFRVCQVLHHHALPFIV